jgi:hypothetical protein
MTRAPLTSEIDESLRRFLLHQDGFPIDLALLLSVTASTPLPHLNCPEPMKHVSPDAPEIGGHAFAIPGLQFRLFYKNVPDHIKRISITIPPHCVLLSDQVESEIRATAEEMRKTSKLVGSLSGRY